MFQRLDVRGTFLHEKLGSWTCCLLRWGRETVGGVAGVVETEGLIDL